jgi:hypothetical protein
MANNATLESDGKSDGKGDKIEGKVQNAVGGLKDTSERSRRRGCLLVLSILGPFTPDQPTRFSDLRTRPHELCPQRYRVSDFAQTPVSERT